MGSPSSFEDTWLNSSKLNLFTDAAGALGFGALFGSHWCYGKWPPNWQYRNIAIFEFYPHCIKLIPLGFSYEQSMHIVFY